MFDSLNLILDLNIYIFGLWEQFKYKIKYRFIESTVETHDWLDYRNTASFGQIINS